MDQTESRLAPSPGPASDDVASPLNLSPAEERAYWRGVADGLTRAGSPVPPDVAGRAAAPASAPPEAPPPPWESEPPEEAGRRRHDAFTGARKQLYLKALAKHGCILDACRVTGISSSTVYNHQASDPDFARNCQLAVGMAATPIELTAYERAVVGHEEEVIRGGKVVGTRVKRSDYMLRVLLQGANPKKYGARPGFGRKRLLAFERKQIEREIEARKAAEARDAANGPDGLTAKLDQVAARIREIKEEKNERLRAEGWTGLGADVWVPPGWAWTGRGDPRDALAELEKNRDAVYNSSRSSTSAAEQDRHSGEGRNP